MKCQRIHMTIGTVLFYAILIAGQPVRAQDEGAGFQPTTAREAVAELYRLVTFEAGTAPDWDRVRALFIDEAIIVLRTGRNRTSQFTVEGFVEDFIGFIKRANASETGFMEKILRMRPTVIGDMAHVLVLYEASVPGSGRFPQRGIDSFQLVRRDGRWWIVSITNEIPRPGVPVPEVLRK